MKSRKKIKHHRWDVPQGRQVVWWQRLTPPQLFIGSFALLILIGTVGLRAVPDFYVDGRPLSWQDALFTATSAVCVTGLTVVDTATYFTRSGQAFLLGLIQLGGLGMLSLTSLVIVAIGKRLSLRSEMITVGPRLTVPEIDIRRLTLDIAKFTFFIEGVGALGLWLIWAPHLGWWDAAWHAVFHSVSAFCNAGFSTFSDSLVMWQTSSLTLLLISFLVILGGFGFLTMEECYMKIADRTWSKSHRLSLHSRIVIWTTAVLLLGGFTLFTVLEWRGVFSHMAWYDRLSNGFFMSVTARTAGFNTIDYSSASDSSNFATMLLMMIGGSPGSAAGGLKTTTFALIGFIAWSKLLGRETTVVFNRSIPEDALKRAIGLLVVSVSAVAGGTLLLLLSQSQDTVDNGFLKYSFETVSAVNTVGLSMGVTGQLNSFSKSLLIFLMFFGRVGPLALVAAFVIRRPGSSRFRLAYEGVNVG